MDVLAWTVLWTVCSTLLSFLLGLILALCLNQEKIWERNLYRVILILPWALPSTITVLTWKGLFNSSYGPINRLIALVGIAPIAWARSTCLVVNIWISFPFMMVACLGALQSIPAEILDAGQVDGANSWQCFRHITFPLLRMATLPLLICGAAMRFGNFGVVFLLTDGGPFLKTSTVAGSTDLLATFMYKIAFGTANYDYGLSAANGLLLFLIFGGLTLLNSRMTGAFREIDS